MVFRKTFNHGLLKAELDIDGDEPLLKLSLDSFALEKVSNGHFDGIQRSDEYNPVLIKRKGQGLTHLGNDEIADMNTAQSIEDTKKLAVEWARKKVKGNFKVIFERE